MITPLLVQEPVLAHTQLCRKQLRQVLTWLVVVLCFILIVLYVDTIVLVSDSLLVENAYIAIVLGISLFMVLAFKGWQYLGNKSQLTCYEKIQTELEQACIGSSVVTIKEVISEVGAKAKANQLISPLLEYYQPMLLSRMTNLHRQSLMTALEEEHALLEAACESKIRELAQQVPLIRAKSHIASSLEFLAKRRQEMSAQWETAYEGFSWWNKMMYSEGADFSEIDKAISELASLQSRLEATHENDLKVLDKHFEQVEKEALSRMSDAMVQASRHIQNCSYEDSQNAGLLKKSLWFSAMSVPVSMWSDLDSAANIYDTLRGVNGNFSNMSDMEVWWESLFLPAESLAGLASLTKGAYFEHLVANDTGGQLFEHFNNPDTDIVIDGVAFQLKATDSAAYVFSVDESIPVIATSEVALATGAIDSGFSNDELTDTIDNALGGTIIDIGDTTVDAVLAGIGGLGLFATLEGINHASRMYENGGDGVEAIFEGAGVAIEGTARSLVGAAEMGYNILASRPSRFVGRMLLNGFIKLDKKLFEYPDEK